jgi:hypothetical protein
MRRVIVAAVLGVFVTTAARAEDGPYSINLKRPGPGDMVQETRTEKTTSKVTINVNGMDQVKEEAATTRSEYTAEVIERPAGAKKPTKLKRTYETAEITKNGEKQDLGLAGKTVLIEKKGDEYSFQLTDGTELSSRAAELLGKEFNKDKSTDDVLLPRKPVKVGESWKLAVADLAKGLSGGGMAIDAARSTATATLNKVYDKDGHRFGVIEVKMDLAVTKIGGNQEVPLKDGSKLDIGVVFDGCIDGSDGARSAKTTMKGTLTGEVNGVGLTIALEMTGSGSTREVRKK